MKIGFVATEIGLQEGGAYMGGNVNNVVTISRELSKRGHDITIITTTPRDAAPNPTESIDWATVYEYSPNFEHGTPGYFISFSTRATRKAVELRRKGELDVLTIHSGFSLWGVIGRGIKQFTDCPVIHVQYCPVNQVSGNRMYDTLQRPWFTRRYLTGMDALVGISPVVSESLKEITKQETVHTVLPAIDTDEYHPILEAEKPDTPTISYLGSFNEQKGLDLLVEAFDRVTESYDCQLKLGLEARSERVENPLAEHIHERSDITVNGIIEDIPRFLAQSHIFVVPFRTTMGPADYPVAALEAMSCGVPLVTTNVGGLNRLIDDSKGGVCVGAPSSKSISSKIVELLDDEDQRIDFGHNAREYVLQECSTDSVVSQFRDVLETCT